MRLLVLSDVHGNLAALEAVLRVPRDAVLCLGDVVGYGPEPAACLARLREVGAVMVQGNHDRSFADGTDPRCRADFRRLARLTRAATHASLGLEDLEYLGALPRWLVPELPNHVRVMAIHAAPSNPLYRYVGPDPAEWEREVDGQPAELILVGHTHLQFDLTAGSRRVANPGSAGQPKDGDPRAAYALLEDGEVRLGRVEYPVEVTVRGLAGLGLPDDALGRLASLLRTGVVPPADAA